MFEYDGVITEDGDVNVAFEIDGTTYYLTYYKSDSNGQCFYIDNGEDYFDTKLILAEKILKQDKIALKSEIPEPVDLTNYALKSENDELKTKLNNYIKSHQDLAKLVGDNVTKIVTMNSQISNLQQENAALKTKLNALMNKIARINYTFNITNSNTIHYQFENQLDTYDGTLYLTYNETKDNVASKKEIKINISFNVNNTPKFEYQCEPTKIWLNNIEFPLLVFKS